MPPLAERSLEQLTRRLRRLAISEGRLQTMALEFFSRPSPASVEAARTWAQRGRQMTRRSHLLTLARIEHQREIQRRSTASAARV